MPTFAKLFYKFLSWLKKFFIQEKSDHTVEFTRSLDDKNGKIHYQFNNDPTMEVVTGMRSIFLHEISISDEVSLARLLKEIMEKDRIDVIEMTNLSVAYKVWKSGFSTDTILNYDPSGNSPVDRFLSNLIKDDNGTVGLSDLFKLCEATNTKIGRELISRKPCQFTRSN